MSVFGDLFTQKRYEPILRNKDGWDYHGHRFPIKGGISLKDVWAKKMAGNIYKPNALFAKLSGPDTTKETPHG